MEKKQISRKHIGKRVSPEQEKEINELQQQMTKDLGRTTSWLEAKHKYFEAKEKEDVVTPEVKELVAKADGYNSVEEMEKANKPGPVKKRCLNIGETKIGLTVVLSKGDCKKIGLSMDQATKEAIVVIREKLGLPSKQIKEENE